VTAEPTNNPVSRFLPGSVRTEEDGRMYFPVFERNVAPICAALEPVLAGLKGAALEIGSGTGQHVQEFARTFPDLVWTPSDPDADHRVSTDAWTTKTGSSVQPVRAIDAATDWAGSVRDLGDVSVILSLNVIHIAPETVLTGILKGAAAVLVPAGILAFYGPFREGGAHTGEGNATFDERLRARNPDWGLRDIDAIVAEAETQGLVFDRLIAMPANNRILVLRRGG